MKTRGIYSTVGHRIGTCPTFQEEQANVVGGFLRQKPRYDPYTNAYNPRWKDHPNLAMQLSNRCSLQST